LLYSKINEKEIDNIFPADRIESITVLKSKAATNKYGDLGKYGVIEIKTKNTKADPIIKEVELFDTTKQNSSLKEVTVVGFPNQNKNEPAFEKVEIGPMFPGGLPAWRKYLEKNLNALVPTDSGASAGAYTVQVKFLVDKNGDVSSIKALTHHGFGMEEEVIRVIAKGPQWIPAKQNGHIVNAFKIQPVTFVIVEDETDDTVVTRSNHRNFPKISLAALQKATAYDLIKPESESEISTFTFTIDNADGHIDEFVNKGSSLMPQTKQLIVNAKAGRIFTIDEIWIIKDGVRKKFPAKVYQVIN